MRPTEELASHAEEEQIGSRAHMTSFHYNSKRFSEQKQ